MKTRILFLLIVLIACSPKQKDDEQTTSAPIPNDLPAMKISLLNGQSIDARAIKTKTVLILFQPDCDHCQEEAKQIAENLEAFKNYNLYFVSSATLPELEKFAKDYHLSDYENILFGQTSTESILNNFGPIQAPSVYIYTEQGKLVNSLNGQVDISVLLKYL
jgi:peroxiredoxin